MRLSRTRLAVLLILGLIAGGRAAPGPATPRPSSIFVVDPFAGGVGPGRAGRKGAPGGHDDHPRVRRGRVGGWAGCNDSGSE